MGAQDIAYGLIENCMPKVGQRPENPIIIPRRIFQDGFSLASWITNVSISASTGGRPTALVFVHTNIVFRGMRREYSRNWLCANRKREFQPIADEFFDYEFAFRLAFQLMT